MMADCLSLEEVLKHFYQRASDAQDRLARLEAVVPDMRKKKEESGESVNLLPLGMEDGKNLEEILKILNERASEAKDRMEKLEAAVPAMRKKKEKSRKSRKSLNLLPLEMMEGGKNLDETLTILNERTSEAEGRVEKLEAVVTAVRNSEDGNVLKALNRKELEDLKAANDADMEQVQKEIDVLKAQNGAEMEQVRRERQNLIVGKKKLNYRISHLIRALQESDSQLMSISCGMIS